MSRALAINAHDSNLFDSGMQLYEKKKEARAALGGTNRSFETPVCTLDISKEAMLKFQNQENDEDWEARKELRQKRKLLTSNDVYRSGRVNSYAADCFNRLGGFREVMRLDEPETYAACEELFHKAKEAVKIEQGGGLVDYGDFEDSEEAQEYLNQEFRLQQDWFYRRCWKNGELYNPIMGQGPVFRELADTYKGVRFDVYSNHYSGSDSSLKIQDYNVLLSADMLKLLLTADTMEDMTKEEAAERKNELQKRIDQAVNGMKEVAKQYERSEGTLGHLRYGVKLWDDGTATYHASFVNSQCCEGGIVASSAEELLEMLLEKG